jgi:hypothetical protein
MGAVNVDLVNNLASVFSGFTSSMQGKNEMYCHLGCDPNLTFSQLQALAASIGNDNISLWFQQVQWPSDQGVTTTYDPWMMAAFAAGFQGGTFPGSSFVNKTFNILGASQNPNIDLINNADQLILARLCFVRYNSSLSSWAVVRALSTYLADANDYHIEPGIKSAVNYAVYAIRTFIQTKYVGSRTLYDQTGSLASSIQNDLIAFSNILQQPPLQVIIPGNQIINGVNQALPALVVDQVSISGDTARLRFQIRPIGSINFMEFIISLAPVQFVATS